VCCANLKKQNRKRSDTVRNFQEKSKSMYESQGEHGGNSGSRRRAVATLAGVAAAVCCVAATAVASGRKTNGRSSNPLGRKSALGIKKLLGSSSSNTSSHLGILNLDDDDEIVHDTSWGYGRESFGLNAQRKKVEP